MNNQHHGNINSTTIMTGAAVATGSALPQQRGIIAQQKGIAQQLATSKTPFMMQSAPVAQYTQVQQQQMMANFQKQKQRSPDNNAHFSSTSSVVTPTQNGNYQSVAGASIGIEPSHTAVQTTGIPGTQTAAVQASMPAGLPLQPQAFQPFHHTIMQQQHIIQTQQTTQTQQQQMQQLQQQQLQQQLQQRALNQQRYQKQVQQKQPVQPAPAVAAAAPTPAALPASPKSTPQPTTGSAGTEEKPKQATETAKTQTTSDNELVLSKEENSSNASETQKTQNLANTKEKTPMCLINELARFNKMHHQYTLVDEQGPAHKKTFYVKLKLGDEEYSASGESIKKAQHAAAAIALEKTAYTHPPPKPQRPMDGAHDDKTDGTITPTVELNALAMKRGEAAVYKSIEPQPSPYYPSNMDFRGMYNQRYQQCRVGRGGDPRGYGRGAMMFPVRYYPLRSRAFYTSLRVGHREFIGDGPTRQAARHSAAQKALRVLKALPAQPQAPPAPAPDQTPETQDDDSLKSEISLVHEIALRRNMIVQFEVTRETGPPHMKTFITCCVVADHRTEGEGNSKKCSKKKAAELMLEELRKLPSLPAPANPRPRPKGQTNKKKNRNLIKSELQQQKADPNYGVGINPISRLIQIMQAQKKKEPVYTLVTERGLPRRREFVVQVEVDSLASTGTGPNKKLAKRAAAEAMLALLGYSKPSPQPTKSSIKAPSNSVPTQNGQTNGGDKKVTFQEGDSPGDGQDKSSYQRVPGLLHLPSKSNNLFTGSNGQVVSGKDSPSVNLSSILKPNLRPEIQLRELCKALDCQLEIDDFTKKRPGGTEHMTRITIGSESPQAFHGSSTTVESSRDAAALDALKVLVARAKDLTPAGDGPQSKKEILARPGSAVIVNK